MNPLRTTLALIGLVTTSACTTSPCRTYHHKVTENDVLAAQYAWKEAIVAIGKAKDHKKAAREYVETLYAYDLGPVLFKPTKASTNQFRDTKEEAISYFVGGKEKEDRGFALAPYVNVRFENNKIALQGDTALAMGNYYFMQPNGQEIKVEYTFGYIEDKDGRLKINLHHSSLPYAGEEQEMKTQNRITCKPYARKANPDQRVR